MLARPAFAPLPDLEAGEEFGRLLMHIDGLDERRRRAAAAPNERREHGLLGAFEHRFNDAVRAVSDPAGEPVRCRARGHSVDRMRRQATCSVAGGAAGAPGGRAFRRRGLTIVRAASMSLIESALAMPMRAIAAATKNVIR